MREYNFPRAFVAVTVFTNKTCVKAFALSIPSLTNVKGSHEEMPYHGFSELRHLPDCVPGMGTL